MCAHRVPAHRDSGDAPEAERARELWPLSGITRQLGGEPRRRARRLGSTLRGSEGVTGLCPARRGRVMAERDIGWEVADRVRVGSAGDVYIRPTVAQAFGTLAATAPHQRGDIRAWIGAHGHRQASVGTRSASEVHGTTIGRQPLLAAKALDTPKLRMDRSFGIWTRVRSVRQALQAELVGLSSHCAMT